MKIVDGEVDHDAPQQRILTLHFGGSLVLEEAQMRFLHQFPGVLARAASHPANLDEPGVPCRAPPHCCAEVPSPRLPISSARVLSD